MKYRIASFFAGVGGIDLGFKHIGEVLYANEFDKNACITYQTNFNTKVDNRDINIIPIEDIPEFDIMLAGFPCQAFSIAGYRQGFDDEKGRGNLFFQLERVFLARKPKVILLENVKNLVSHDKGRTFSVILDRLHNAGYNVKYSVLNSMNYGNLPQNRERIYIVAFNSKMEDKYYYTPTSFKQYDILKSGITSQETVYQWRRKYVRENKSNVSPTLTANMGTGGHNVPLILSKTGIRKLTPKECFNLQGFPEDYQLPDIAISHLYKQAGNSVSVPVISRIADNIKKVLEMKK